MPKNTTPKKISSTPVSEPPFIVSHKSLAISLLAVSIFVVFSALWWKNVYNSPHRVFEAMLRNNLSTASVTRRTVTEDPQAPSDKIEQISFVPTIASHNVVSIKQASGSGSSEVLSESIGTAASDFNRYLSIKTDQKGVSGQALDYRAVQNIWGKTELPQTPQYLSQSLLSLVPFGNLNSTTREQVLKTLHDNKAYEVDYAQVKHVKRDGKSAIEFPVQVNLAGYVEALKLVAQAAGIKDVEGLDAESYQGQPPISITVTVDKLSRQVLEISYGEGQKEVYSAYGLSSPVALPEKSIPLSELQQKVQQVQ